MNTHDKIQREILPVPDIPQVGLTTYDAKDPQTQYPPIAPLRPPAGAPNVLIILLDDLGFGAPSVFGGPCYTPTAERLAANGLRYNRFHTTALCSPTRQALLTGRNHHSAGMGCITEQVPRCHGRSVAAGRRRQRRDRDAGRPVWRLVAVCQGQHPQVLL